MLIVNSFNHCNIKTMKLKIIFFVDFYISLKVICLFTTEYVTNTQVNIYQNTLLLKPSTSVSLLYGKFQI